MKSEKRDKVVSSDYGSNISSPLARMKGVSTSDELSQQKQENTKLKQNGEVSASNWNSTGFSRIIHSSKFQLIFMIMVPELCLIMISIGLIQANISYSSNSVGQFSENLFKQQIYFVKLQDAAVQMSLAQQMQNEAVLLQIMHAVQFKALRGKVTFHSDYQKPVLNIESTYANKGDSYLLSLFRKNLTLLISSWHNKNALEEDGLDSFSQGQIYLTSRIDFILRSALRSNRIEVSMNPNKLLIFQYFYPFGHDGMYYSTGGTNMTYATFVDLPPCTSGKYNLDLRCRPYYLASKSKDIMTVFPPMVFYGGTDALPYVSSGICKRQAVPLSMMDDFQVSSLNNGIYCLVCNSIKLEQISLLFERFQSDPRVLIMLLEPISMRLVYSSGVKMKQGEILTLEKAYLSSLDTLADREYFLQQINQYASERMASFCYPEGQDSASSKTEDQSFQFTQKSGEIVVFINHISSSDVSQFHTDDVYGENSPVASILNTTTIYLSSNSNTTTATGSTRRKCKSSYWMFLTIIPKVNLLQEAHALEEQMTTINIIFESVTYAALGISLLIFSFYLKTMSDMMDIPIKRLTQILKEMNVYEAASAANHLSEEESYDFFYSSDARVLFESFRRLFETLVFATQSMFGENQCQTLLNLNKQILHFKQLKNYRALGVCLNNIGNIHFNNSRYKEALESYSMALIYIQYELQIYKEDTRIAIPCNKRKLKDVIQGIFQIKQYFFETYQPAKENTTKDFQVQESEQELYWILYNRKFNYLKSLIGLMASNNQFLTDWVTVQNLADELQEICAKNLPFCKKRQILVNHCEMLIHYHTGDVDNCERLLNQNKNLLQLMGVPKIIINNSPLRKSKMKQRSKRDIPKLNVINPKICQIKNEKCDNANQGNESNNMNLNNEFSANKRIPRIKISQNLGVESTVKKPINRLALLSVIQSTQIRENRANSDLQPRNVNSPKENGSRDDSLGFSKSNLKNIQIPLAEDNSFSMGKQNNSGYYLIGTPQRQQEQQQHNDKEEMTFSSQFLAKNQQTIQKYKTTMDKQTLNSYQYKHQPLNERKSLKSLFQRRDHTIPNTASSNATNLQSPNFLKNPKNPNKKCNNLFNYERSESLRNINTSNQYPKQRKSSRNDTYLESSQAASFAGLVKSNNYNHPLESSFVSVQSCTRQKQNSIQLAKKPSNKKIIDSYDQQFEFSNLLFDGVVQEEEGTVLLLKSEKYNSAKVFTAFYEETKIVLPFIQYQVFNKLSFIFSEVGLRDSELERLAANYESDTSFKIAVLIFNPNQEKERNITVKEESVLFDGERDRMEGKQEGLIQIDTVEDIQQESLLAQSLISERSRSQKLFQDAIFRLCIDIAEKVITKGDDMLGVAVASDPWRIEQKIEMLSSKFIKLNFDLFQRTIEDIIEDESIVLQFSGKVAINDRDNADNSDCNNLNTHENISVGSFSSFSKQQNPDATAATLNLQQKKEYEFSSPINSENGARISPSLILETFGELQQDRTFTPLSHKTQENDKLSAALSLKQESKTDKVIENDHHIKLLFQSSYDSYDQNEMIKLKGHNLGGKPATRQAYSQLRILKPSNNMRQLECMEILNPDSSLSKSCNEDQQEEVEEFDSLAQISSVQKAQKDNGENTDIEIQDNNKLKDAGFFSSEGSPLQEQIKMTKTQSKSSFMKLLQERRKKEEKKNEDSLKSNSTQKFPEILSYSQQQLAESQENPNAFSLEVDSIRKIESPSKKFNANTLNALSSKNITFKRLLIPKILSKPFMKTLDKNAIQVKEPQGTSCLKTLTDSSLTLFSDSSNQSSITSSHCSSVHLLAEKTALNLRKLFLFGVRKALQAVLQCGGDPMRIHLQVKLATARNNENRNSLEMLKKIRNLNHFLLNKKQNKQEFKRFAVIATNSLDFISPSDQVLVLLYQELIKFSAQLYILCLNEGQAMKFQQGIPLKYIDIVVLFTSEKSIIDHLLFSRSPPNFNYYPLTVEHF